MTLALQTKTRLARIALLRHTTAPDRPETKLLVDVIVQAITDAAAKPSKHFYKAVRTDAKRFFDDGRMAQLCDVIGLPTEYANHVVKQIRGA